MGKVEDKVVKRNKFFLSQLNGFIKNDIESNTQAWKEEILGLDFETVGNLEDTANLINDRYWELMNNAVKTSILPPKDADKNKKRADLYKILSCTEFAIMSVKPFIAKISGRNIDYVYSSDNLALHYENLLNAKFAFTTAINLLGSWEGDYSNNFSNTTIIDIINQKEDNIPERKNVMSILEEHLVIMAYSSSNPILPIFTNSTWWRLLCKFSELKFKN